MSFLFSSSTVLVYTFYYSCIVFLYLLFYHSLCMAYILYVFLSACMHYVHAFPLSLHHSILRPSPPELLLRGFLTPSPRCPVLRPAPGAHCLGGRGRARYARVISRMPWLLHAQPPVASESVRAWLRACGRVWAPARRAERTGATMRAHVSEWGGPTSSRHAHALSERRGAEREKLLAI